ncbi:MAG: dihydrofolate reductase family protein [Longimicrobiaceae bacterium]
MTIDGYAADPNSEMDFIQDYAARNDTSFQADAERFLDTVDTMMLGANTYELFVAYWPEATDEGVFAEKLNSLSKIVVSTTLESASWGKWEGAEITSNPAEKLAQLKQQQGKDIVVWGSLTLARSLMKEALIDEYQLRVCPVVLGEGKRIFADGIAPVGMELLEAKTYDAGMVLLRYRPKRR